MDDLFAAPIPSESDATCDDCAMCAGSDEEKAASTTFFDPHVKCKENVANTLDYEQFLNDAVTLEGGPGDVIYWPLTAIGDA